MSITEKISRIEVLEMVVFCKKIVKTIWLFYQSCLWYIIKYIWSVSGPTPSSSDRKTDYVQTVPHQKTVPIRPTTSLYTGTGGGSILFQGPLSTGAKIFGRGNEATLGVFRVIFHLDNPSLLPAVPTNYACGTDPLAGAGAAPMSPATTETNAPKIATPTAIGSGNQVSNFTQSTWVQGAEQEVSANHDSYITSEASSGANYDDSYYVELRENFPASSDNSLKLNTFIEGIL